MGSSLTIKGGVLLVAVFLVLKFGLPLFTAPLPMSPDHEPYFPYPPDPARRFGFIIGDILSAGVIILILTAILKF